MNLETLIAQWSGQLPPGFVPPAERPEALDRCSQKRCKNPVAIKKNGEPPKPASAAWIAGPDPASAAGRSSSRRAAAGAAPTGSGRKRTSSARAMPHPTAEAASDRRRRPAQHAARAAAAVQQLSASGSVPARGRPAQAGLTVHIPPPRGRLLARRGSARLGRGPNPAINRDPAPDVPNPPLPAPHRAETGETRCVTEPVAVESRHS